MKDSLNNSSEHEAAFVRSYRDCHWGGGSGPGSRADSTVPYRKMLEDVLRRHGVRRVVDLGCGDWQFSRLIDWKGIDYLGVDVVPAMIREHTAKFARDNIRFARGDIRQFEMPEADLFIIKDLLQHWPTADIRSFLKRMGRRRMLVTNTLSQPFRRPVNSEIPLGDYRPLALLEAPFKLRRAEILLEYEAEPGDHKQVLLVNGPPATGRAPNSNVKERVAAPTGKKSATKQR
jgi:SAM-dependent methyltransferase